MKKAFLIIWIAVISIICCFVLYRNNILKKGIRDDTKLYYWKVITLSDFPEDKLLLAEYMDKVNISISQNEVGWKPENAIVNLIFDKHKILYTPKRFNKELDNNELKNTIEYITDIKTYQQITQISEATSEYTNAMPNRKWELIRIFDAYVKFFEKTKQY